jgi:hypothetical protein
MSINPLGPNREAEPQTVCGAFEVEWARCEAWIRSALDMSGGSHAIEDVKAAVERGEARLWGWTKSAAVTEVQTWPRARFLLIWLAGGDLEELRDVMLPLMEAYGREQGCTRCYIVGRPGWSRVLPGYHTVAISLAKELSH